jgi:mono/diheme cytochrome c family protein
MKVRLIVAGLLVLGASQASALAETPVQRGSYLVNTIMACGNCHTPRDSQGKLIPERTLSGGVTFTTPAFTATAANITPDQDTGIGTWTDADIKRALATGLRPEHGHLAGSPLAAVMPANFYKGLLPADLDSIIVYLRSVKPVRNEVADQEYKLPVQRVPYPDAEQGFTNVSPLILSRAANILLPSVTAWNVTRRGLGVCRTSQTAWVMEDARSDQLWSMASIQPGRVRLPRT